MKKLFFIAVILAAVMSVQAQNTANADGDVTLEMADGTKVRGWNRTKFMNKIGFIEISDTPKGKRTRYDNDQVTRVVFDEGAVYVKKDICTNIKKEKTTPGRWVRLEVTESRCIRPTVKDGNR